MINREIENKRNNLLSFIKWKCRCDADLEETLRDCSTMSYEELRRWAIRNDIIDD